MLEIASGSGQHAIHFAEALPDVEWQPTDHDPEALASIDAWRAESGLSNLLAARSLDASSADWSEAFAPVDAIFNANMIHISPWLVTEGLFAGAARALSAGGALVLYGPFRIGGVHTAPSNAAFDESLRARDPGWGVRDLERVVELAEAGGLSLEETTPMPANNQLVVFRRA